MYFDETQLNDHVLDALYDMHFDKCTPIQEQCIPPILEGRDLLGVAQTGTGKTAAYLLPILSRLDDGGYPHDAINCVIMSPTRELAQQIDQAMQGFGYYLDGVSSVAVYGGNDGNRYDQELKSFQMGADVVIATPGRLISHISLGSADLSKVSFFVLDEADRMLDMGFSEDIKMIASKLPKTCQTIMFSATMPEKIEELAKTLLNNPVEVKIAVSKPAEKIKQSAYVCYETQKIGIIKDLFRKGDLNRVIIFSGKKQKVKAINRTLQQMKINSGEMHSDLEQAERDEILYKFKTGQIDVLVATDIVARGIDIDDIAMVINFDVPHDPEDYVHRIGRTARAERDGVAITFVAEDEIYSFKQIEKFLEKVVDKNPLPEGLGDAPDYNAGGKKGGSSRSRQRGGSQRKGNTDRKRQGKGRGNGEGGKKRDNNTGNKAQDINTAEANADNKTADNNAADNATNSKADNNAANGDNNAANGDNNAANGDNEQKPRRKRNRKPRRKPENGEAKANEATTGSDKPNGDQTRQPRKSNKPRQQPTNRGDNASNDGNKQQRKPSANQRRRRQGDNKGGNQRDTAKAGATANGAPQAATSLPAVKQSSAISKILTKPISWLKSLGKKK